MTLWMKIAYNSPAVMYKKVKKKNFSRNPKCIFLQCEVMYLKGQLISKCTFLVYSMLPENQQIFLKDFWPSL